MNELEQVKVKTEIEKNLHMLVTRDVKDHIRDFVMLAAQRNHVPVEKASLEWIVKTMEMACDDAFRRNVDQYADRIVAESLKYANLVDQDLLKQKLAPKE
jgi:hypothetical protein